MDESSLQSINWDAKVDEFINHDKEWGLHSIVAFLPSNVLTNIKVVPIHVFALEDRFFRVSFKMVGLHLNQ